MESSTSSPDEVNSKALSNNKRKLQHGPKEMPLPKHVCWKPDPPREVENDGSHREIESDPESAKDSNSFLCKGDSTMSTDAAAYSNTRESGESSSSTCTGCLGYECGPALDYEGYLVEFTSEAENCVDEEIENMLYGIPPSDYVLSSGRWSVVQDTLEMSKKPTIDKEFEEYFSMLML